MSLLSRLAGVQVPFFGLAAWLILPDEGVPVIDDSTNVTNVSFQGIVGCTPTNVPLWEIPI